MKAFVCGLLIYVTILLHFLCVCCLSILLLAALQVSVELNSTTTAFIYSTFCGAVKAVLLCDGVKIQLSGVGYHYSITWRFFFYSWKSQLRNKWNKMQISVIHQSSYSNSREINWKNETAILILSLNANGLHFVCESVSVMHCAYLK